MATISAYVYGERVTMEATGEDIELKVNTLKLEVSNVSSENLLDVGDEFVYVIRVANSGDVEIKDIILSDEIPPQLLVKKICINGKNLGLKEIKNLNIGNLQPNEVKNIVMTTRVMEGNINNFKSVVNTRAKVQVDEKQQPMILELISEDEGSINVGEEYVPKMKVKAYMDKSMASVGDIITYKIIVENNTGMIIGDNIDPVVIYNQLSPSARFVQGSLMINNKIFENISMDSGVNIISLNKNEYVVVEFEAMIVNDFYGYVENISRVEYGYSLAEGIRRHESVLSNKVYMDIS